jgi:hypothetical protein
MLLHALTNIQTLRAGVLCVGVNIRNASVPPLIAGGILAEFGIAE